MKRAPLVPVMPDERPAEHVYVWFWKTCTGCGWQFKRERMWRTYRFANWIGDGWSGYTPPGYGSLYQCDSCHKEANK